MATTLSQVLSFVAVAPASNVTLPHTINVNGTPSKPDILLPDNEVFTLVACTTTSITVRNTSSDVASLKLWLWRQNTPDRAYGAASITSLSPQPFWVGGNSGTVPGVAPYGYVKLDQFMAGTPDLSRAINAALAALGTNGGTIDARNVNPTGYTFLSTVTIDKPITLLLGPGEYASSVPLMFSVVATKFPAGNFVVRGMDPLGSRLTAFPNGTIFKLDGDFYDFAGDGKPYFSVSNLTLDGLAGTSIGIDASNAGFTLNFQDGLILVEDCTITRFGNTVGGAVWIGPSVYFIRIHRNEFIDNYCAVFLDNNTEVAVTENMFIQGALGGPSITSIGPMHRIVNNYFYRHQIVDTSTAPDILLLPIASWASQSGGYVWILDNRFGGERENFNTARSRIRLFSSLDNTIVAGPAIVRGNQFIGPSCGITSLAATGGVATCTVSTANMTQSLVAGVSVVVISDAIDPRFNGTFTVIAVNPVSPNTFTFAVVAGVYACGAGGGVRLDNGHAISLENPSLPWDISTNYFGQYGVLINDAQPQLVSASGFGNSLFYANRVASLDDGYKVFANEGRGFGVGALPGNASMSSWNDIPRIVETASLVNRLPASEALDTWSTNATFGSLVTVTAGQTDPHGGATAFLATIHGTGTSQWVGQQFYTADLAVHSRVVVTFWAKASTAKSVAVGVFDHDALQFISAPITFSLSTTWKQYKFVSDGLPVNPAITNYQLLFYPANADMLTGAVFLWQPQVSDTDSNYLPNLNATGVIAAAVDSVNGARYEKGIIVPQIQIGTPTITSGAGVPGGVPTVGSLYLRTGGGAGSTLYVCEVAGAWQAK